MFVHSRYANRFCENALMAAWVVAVGALGYMSGTTSFAGWSLLAVVSLPPPALIVWLWSAPLRARPRPFGQYFADVIALDEYGAQLRACSHAVAHGRTTHHNDVNLFSR